MKQKSFLLISIQPAVLKYLTRPTDNSIEFFTIRLFIYFEYVYVIAITLFFIMMLDIAPQDQMPSSLPIDKLRVPPPNHYFPSCTKI
mmetsp:Transcript_29567/g.44801  ORF Transcript_29567/g.44801 Transcript_29567/m.44801 type:complete len:87 (-) Transcript_29567:1567-1827(-)